MRKSTSGFTIVELLVVIVVIATLAAIAVVSYNGIQQRASDSRARAEVGILQKALELYYIDHGGYPTCSGAVYQPGNPYEACYTDDPEFVSALSTYISNTPYRGESDERYYYAVGAMKAGEESYYVNQSNNYIIATLLEAKDAGAHTVFGSSNQE